MKKIPLLALTAFLVLVSCTPEKNAQTTPVVTNRGQIPDNGHGKELWFAFGAVSGVPGVPVNGTAQTHVMEDGTSLVVMQINVNAAPASEEFRAWLLNAAGDRVDLGQLNYVANDVQHGLSYGERRDLTGYTSVEITRRRIGSAETGTLQATGTLIKRTR